LKLVSFKHDGRATYGLLQADRYLQPPADFLNRYPDLVSVLRGDALRELESVSAASGTGKLVQEVISNTKSSVDIVAFNPERKF